MIGDAKLEDPMTWFTDDDSIRIILRASDTNTSEAQLEGLSRHPSSLVRLCVAGNLSCPLDVLIRLTGDSGSGVRDQALQMIEERGIISLLGEG